MFCHANDLQLGPLSCTYFVISFDLLVCAFLDLFSSFRVFYFFVFCISVTFSCE